MKRIKRKGLTGLNIIFEGRREKNERKEKEKNERKEKEGEGIRNS